MRSKRKRFIAILLISVMVLGLCTPVTAANKDVTSKYKKTVSKLLDPFDGYFGYGCARGMKFKYNAYARTTMVYLPNSYSIYGKSTSYAKKKLASQMKKYFDSTTVKLKKFKRYEWPKNPSYLIQNQNGKIVYVGGDWGEVYPKGTVSKITKTSSKRFTVTYKINWYNDVTEKKGSLMGIYKIYLKKKGNRFVITNIKQTKTNNVSV